MKRVRFLTSPPFQTRARRFRRDRRRAGVGGVSSSLSMMIGLWMDPSGSEGGV
jgi:hypothetical protein